MGCLSLGVQCESTASLSLSHLTTQSLGNCSQPALKKKKKVKMSASKATDVSVEYKRIIDKKALEQGSAVLCVLITKFDLSWSAVK